jgi:single-stranded-DNA-specific exonuclease
MSLSAPSPRWILRPVDELAVSRVRASTGTSLSPLVQRLLAQRDPGSEEDVQRFLQPKLQGLTDPFLLPNMAAAVERLLQAVDRKERVVLYGDYDVDGVSSLTLLRTVLRAYGLDPRCFLPLRMEEGYGLSPEGLQRCLEDGGADLLVAVDCGTTASREAEWLASQGIELIILDHHEPDPNRVPQCAALVNPKLGSAFHFLCSAGVVFKLGHAMAKRRPNPSLDLKSQLDIVALATVADIVPLVDENRIFVRKGLEQLELRKRPGLAALIEVAGVKSPLDSMDLGFRLGPRLNAAGRLDTAQTALDLLLSEGRDEAMALATALDRQNRERQEVEHLMQQQAQALADVLASEGHAGLVIASEGWHPGVVGIVAARLTRRYHRPVFVIAVDENGLGKGSGRSVEGLSLVAALDACRDLLVAGGGHDAAAGLSLHRDRLAEFSVRFHEHIRSQIRGSELEPKLYLDAETRLSDLTLEFLDAYELLQPFGQGNARPVFLARGVQPVNEPRLLRERHWKFEFYQEGTVKGGIWFNGAHDPLPPPPWDIAFYVDRNTFRGETHVQLLVQAMRTSAGAA